jgi:hypothetical protein
MDFGASHDDQGDTNIDDATAAAGPVTNSMAAQTGSTDAISHRYSSLVIVHNWGSTAPNNFCGVFDKASAMISTKDVATSSPPTTHPIKVPTTLTTVSTTLGDLSFTEKGFSSSEAVGILNMCHGQLDMAKATYNGSNAKNVRQILKIWLSMTGGASALVQVTRSDD